MNLKSAYKKSSFKPSFKNVNSDTFVMSNVNSDTFDQEILEKYEAAKQELKHIHEVRGEGPCSDQGRNGSSLEKNQLLEEINPRS